MDIINKTAQDYFQIPWVFPCQRLVISNILSASGYFGPEAEMEVIKKQMVILPTGAGKSLCFMLPALLIPGITLIVFPLLSLIADQERRILETGSDCAVITGRVKGKEREAVFKKIRNNEVSFILTNPESLNDTTFKQILKETPLIHGVIDETHTVSQWGDTFRPACLDTGKNLKEIGIPVITAFTATASENIISRVKEVVFLNEPVNLIEGNPDRPNIHYTVLPCLSKTQALLHILNSAELPAIVFHSSRISAEITSASLRRRTGREDIVCYHAGMTSEEKTSVEKWFFQSETGVLHATCAYGMGVDKKNIRTVIHMDIPSSVEAYLQESGRAGRDRAPSRAYVLLSPNDRERGTRMIPGEKASYENIVNLLSDNTLCRREGLLQLLGRETEDCEGCDVCDGSLETVPREEKLLCSFIHNNKNRFTRETAIRVLKGYHSPDILNRSYHRCPGFSILSHWETEDLQEAIDNLTLSGKLKCKKSYLFKNKLTT